MVEDHIIADQAEWIAERTPLSKREAEVTLQYTLAPNDMYKKDVAEAIGIEPQTLSDHLTTAREKIDRDSASDAYWLFGGHVRNNMDMCYRPLFRAPDGNGNLVVFEHQFWDDYPEQTRFYVVHEHPEQSVVDHPHVARRRSVTDWYAFNTPEELAEGVLSVVEFDQSGMAGTLGKTVFIDSFEDEFGFDPTEVEEAFEFDGLHARDIPETHRRLFAPRTPDSEVLSTLVAEYDRFAEWYEGRDAEDMMLKNPRLTDDATIVVEDISPKGRVDKAVLTLDDEVFCIVDEVCDCGHVNDYSRKRGEPSKSAYDRKRSESCEHNVAALNATDVASQATSAKPTPPADAEHSPCCSVCGYTAIQEHRKHNQGEWVMSSYSCALCGEDLGDG